MKFTLTNVTCMGIDQPMHEQVGAAILEADTKTDSGTSSLVNTE